MTSWHTYPKIYAIGHGAVSELFYDEVIVQEKIDGSQFSFGIFEGALRFKSKNNEFSENEVEGLFTKAVESVLSIKEFLLPGWTYRAEYIQKPKHNVLAYSRCPTKNLILFDINTGEETYAPYEQVAGEAARMGLEVVPLLFKGKISTSVDLERLLDTTSILGGQKIEGFVVKNYSRFGRDKKALMGKFVSESFKEVHKAEWKEGNPGSNDIIQKLVAQYRTTARWDKAIQHMRESGVLENSPKDIGKVLKEAHQDILAECGEEIQKQLMDWAWKSLSRGLNRGLAEYYKEILFKSQQFDVAKEDGNEAA